MGCAESENPPFPNGEITLKGLRDACIKYHAIESYPLAVNNFRKARHIGEVDAQSAGDIDLREEQQVKELIALFLNPWQCRLPNPDGKNIKPEKLPLILERFKRTHLGLAAWWERYAETLPGLEARLLTADDGDIERCLELFEELCDVRIAVEVNYKRKYFGDVAASKTLYILRPHLFVPWDNAIQKTLEYTGGCGRFYVRYLKRVRDRLKELDEDFAESGVPGSGLAWLLNEIPGQQSCTPVELMNKFYWASVPRKNDSAGGD